MEVELQTIDGEDEGVRGTREKMGVGGRFLVIFFFGVNNYINYFNVFLSLFLSLKYLYF